MLIASMGLQRCLYLCACVAFGLPMSVMAEEYIGLVHPSREITLSMGVGGVVSSLKVAPGQRVKANQTLLVLDDRMQSIEVDRRKVVYEDMSEIRSTKDRVRVLRDMYQETRKVFERTGSISRDELSKLEIEYSTARGRLDQLEAQKAREHLEYEGALHEKQMRQLTAPVAGVITRIEPKVGEWAKPGDTLMELVDASVCFLKANVPLKSVQGLRVGMRIPVRFEIAANATPVEGKISFLSTVADPASSLVELRITFANPALRIRPGIKGMIDLPNGGAGS
jgi:RND family efflux transporter MFP subunit